ncbi:putative RNA methyltransferase [Propionibacterium sp.]|uniref:putative RNA methyltransferase n=1 Tax=Propionibacterium sp. TaxID=1977903 RepID=UPI0039E9AFBB
MRIPAALDAATNLLVCPVCRARGNPDVALTRQGTSLRCTGRHSFDIARQGYVNLAAAAEPANADSAEMIAARERFLGSGVYQPILDALVAALPDTGFAAEVGSGPGWYLSGVLDAHPELVGLASDVSVSAAKRAAQHGLASIVADTWAGLPICSGVLDALVCVFAPRNAAEFARVLRPGGLLVVVFPTSRHLANLREELGLLDVQAGKQDTLGTQMAAATFAPAGHELVEFSADCSQDQIRDLVAMGPNAFHTHPEDAVAATIQVSVGVDLFRAPEVPH